MSLTILRSFWRRYGHRLVRQSIGQVKFNFANEPKKGHGTIVYNAKLFLSNDAIAPIITVIDDDDLFHRTIHASEMRPEKDKYEAIQPTENPFLPVQDGVRLLLAVRVLPPKISVKVERLLDPKDSGHGKLLRSKQTPAPCQGISSTHVIIPLKGTAEPPGGLERKLLQHADKPPLNTD